MGAVSTWWYRVPSVACPVANAHGVEAPPRVGGDRRRGRRSVGGATIFLVVRATCRDHDGTECASSRGSVRGYLWAQGMHWLYCLYMEVNCDHIAGGIAEEAVCRACMGDMD